VALEGLQREIAGVYLACFLGPDTQVRVKKVDAKYSGINKLGQFVAIEELRVQDASMLWRGTTDLASIKHRYIDSSLDSRIFANGTLPFRSRAKVAMTEKTKTA
jgi:hypothetical protein